MWSPNELLKTEKQRDILSYITLQFFPFKKVPLEHYPKVEGYFLWRRRRDLNPRYPFGVYTISNRARSASYATSP